jgi:GrpB-like predicted nucleotidyltransferase (UPF0157 family)
LTEKLSIKGVEEVEPNENVYFKPAASFKTVADQLYALHKEKLLTLLPYADIHHVGSTAVPDSLTKGDVDIQIRVPAHHFSLAKQRLSSFYQVNKGSIQTNEFCAFETKNYPLPIGIQLTAIHSEFDMFWRITKVLIGNTQFQKAYDQLKRRCNGATMENYRKDKKSSLLKFVRQ